MWESPYCTVCGYILVSLALEQGKDKKPKRGERLSWEGGAEEDFVCSWEGNNGTRGRN